MPDDNEEKVTEQETPVVDPSPEEVEADMITEFEKDEDGEEADTLIEDEETEEGGEAEEEGVPGEEEAAEEREDAKAEGEEEVEDEDLKLGQELLDQREKDEKARADRDAAAEKERKEQEARREQEKVAGQPISQEIFDGYAKIIPPAIIPDSVTINGEEFDLRSFTEEFPVITPLAGIAARGVINNLVENGVLFTAEQVTAKIEEVQSAVSQTLFMNRVTDPNYGIPNALAIWESKEFGEWRKNAAKAEEALLSSDNPDHVIRGLKRYLSAAGLDKAKKEAAAIDEETAAKKKKADSVYKTTVKGKKRVLGGKRTTMDDGPDALDEEFNRDDKDDEEYY